MKTNKVAIEDTLLLIKKAIERDDKRLLKILNIQLYTLLNKYINNDSIRRD